MRPSIPDDHPTCSATYATLRVVGRHPDEVTAALGLKPTRGFVRGKPWQTPSGRLSRGPAREHVWLLGSEHRVDSRNVLTHVEWLLAQVEASGEALRELQASGCK